jgi:hypothetical protein
MECAGGKDTQAGSERTRRRGGSEQEGSAERGGGGVITRRECGLSHRAVETREDKVAEDRINELGGRLTDEII